MDKNIAIEFQGVGKQYRLGRVGTGTLQHDLNRFWQTKIMGREDPYLKIGEVNDRSEKAHSDYVWALKDINFKVEQGDVVGIIGKNGAGKSTLLKLLSHITAPSTGDIFYRGRIASLLEVGTGFHGELTGKENIYMNGAVLGMTKHEIKRKLDDIIEFAGVEKYIDTPVKRYSSGMTVRLGFAVAAFLEPEILVVDEVLTVGDAEFQERAIGKMDDVAKNGGRTVLFVSHNMSSIRALCKNGIILENGGLKYQGTANDVVDMYLHDNKLNLGDIAETNDFCRPIKITGDFEIIHLKRCFPYILDGSQPIIYQVKIKNKSSHKRFYVTTLIDDTYDSERAGLVSTKEISWDSSNEFMTLQIKIYDHHLSKGKYTLDVWIHTGNVHSMLSFHDAVYKTLTFEIGAINNIVLNDWKNYWGKIYYNAEYEVLN